MCIHVFTRPRSPSTSVHPRSSAVFLEVLTRRRAVRRSVVHAVEHGCSRERKRMWVCGVALYQVLVVALQSPAPLGAHRRDRRV